MSDDTAFWIYMAVVFGPFIVWTVYELYRQYVDFVRGDL